MPFDVNYSDRYKCLYIHVPKTGGCSVCDALDTVTNHHTALQCKRMWTKKFNDYWVFSIIRHPYDRLVSAWEYLRQGGCGNAYDLKLQRKLRQWEAADSDFDVFCQHALMVVSREWLHFLPQTYFLCDGNGVSLCDSIGTYENMEESWKYIQEMTGCDTPLPHINPTPNRRPWWEYFTNKDTQRQVDCVYHSDFETWHYTRGRSSIGRASVWQTEGFVGSSPIDSTPIT